MEAPSYPGAIQSFQACQANFVEVPTDDNGPIIEELERILATHEECKTSCMPSLSSRTRAATHGPLQRRKEVMELANRYEMLIVER